MDGKSAGKSDTGHTHLYAGSDIAGGKANSAKTADSVDWANVTGKPSTFAPTSHKHTKSDITDFPMLGTAAAKNVGDFAAASHTHDDRYYTESEVNVKLGEKLHEETVTNARDLNTIKTTGVYHLKTTSHTNGPGIQNHATLFVDYTVGTPYQIFIPDSVNRAWRRNHLNSDDTWSAWTELKYTDTNTWRGIQNNLTSDSITDSLSAAQGKALKALVDGKAASGHTHDYLSLGGGTVTGSVAVTGAYIQAPMITGEISGSTSQYKKAHGIQLGIPSRDYCNFYEYGGIWNFYNSKDAYTQGSGDGVLIAKIDKDGFHGNLKGTADAVPWSGITGKPSVVRSVSYSGGTLSVNTDGAASAYGIGGIAASGSNYVRFTDGTQICWGSLTTKSFTVKGTYYHSDYGYQVSCTANKNNTRPAAQFPVAFVNGSYGITLNTSYGVLSDNNTFKGVNGAQYGSSYLETVTSVSPALGKQTTHCVFAKGAWGEYVAVGRWK